MDSLRVAMVEEGSGVRFNPDLLRTNALNIFLVLGLLIYYGRGFLGNRLRERQQTIAQTVAQAETAQKEAAAALQKAQDNLAQAQVMAAKLKQEGGRKGGTGTGVFVGYGSAGSRTDWSASPTAD